MHSLLDARRRGSRVLAAIAELAMNPTRKIWGISGEPGVWSGDVNSSHNSQYMTDPTASATSAYGMLLYALSWLFARSAAGSSARADGGVRGSELGDFRERGDHDHPTLSLAATISIALLRRQRDELDVRRHLVHGPVSGLAYPAADAGQHCRGGSPRTDSRARIRDGLFLNIVMLIHPGPSDSSLAIGWMMLAALSALQDVEGARLFSRFSRTYVARARRPPGARW